MHAPHATIFARASRVRSRRTATTPSLDAPSVRYRTSARGCDRARHGAAANGHARALVIGVETGALAVAIAGGDDAAGCTALCVDASNAMLDRCAEALGRDREERRWRGRERARERTGVRFLRASDTKALKPYHGPFDAAAFSALGG